MNHKKISTRKDYTWKKEWVRPYESIYSIFINFCRVNMIYGASFRQMFGMRINGYGRYICEFLLYDRLYFNKDSQHNYTELLPTWYQEQMRIFTNMDENNARRCLYTDQIYYCPKCLKEEGYHSILHQIRDISNCPFHPEQTILCSEKQSDYKISEIECEVEKVFRFKNAYSYILPCFRRNNVIYQRQALRITSRYDRIWQECSLDHPDHTMKNIYCLLSGFKPKRTMFAEQLNVSDEHLIDGFISWFNHSNHLRDFTHSPYPYKVEWLWYRDYHLLYFYIYHKYMEIMGDDLLMIDSKKLLPKNVERIKYNGSDDLYSFSNIVICDMVLLKVYFISMLHDGPYSLAALNYRWLEHPFGYENTWQHRTQWGYKAQDLVNNNEEITYFSRIDNVVIKCNIISDFIDELWRQYVLLASRPNGVGVYDAWKELELPVYYVCHVRHQNYYEIMRY